MCWGVGTRAATPCYSSARCCQTCASSSSLARALGGIICASLQPSCRYRSALIDGRVHLWQRPGATQPERLFLPPFFSDIPFHLKAGEPLHIAWEVDIRSHALRFVG